MSFIPPALVAVPLRYGAGVKGQWWWSAIHRWRPIVFTSTGCAVRAFPLWNPCWRLVDEPEAFATGWRSFTMIMAAVRNCAAGPRCGLY